MKLAHWALLGLLCGCTAIIDGSEQEHAPPEGSVGGSGWLPGTPEPVVLLATPRLARLSRLQWESSLRTLLGLEDLADVTALVTGDALVGFDNEADALRVGERLRADLEKAAQTLAERVATDPAALARLVPGDAPADTEGRGRAFIVDFGRRAYRRPLTEAEVQSYAGLFGQAAALFPGEDAFAAGVKLLLTAFLQSPHFLYRTELGTQASAGRIALSDYEVSAKLALSLTNTMPDQTAFAAAAAGQLHTPEQVAAEAARLLESAPGAAGRDNLHFQVYRLGAYDGIVRSPTTYPEFSSETPRAMRDEVLLFLRHVFDQGQGVAGIFTEPVGFVNARLAPLYGLSGTFGESLTRVDLDPAQRSGLLTLPGFLASYAVVDDPDTIHRGVFVNQRILCRELPPPDPNATVLVPLDAGMTNRERVEATTGTGTCGEGCHSTVINPPGFAFEHFDAVGKYRALDRGKPVNAASSYAFDEGLKAFVGAVDFSHLLAESAQAHACYIESWMSYVNGHPLQAEERPLLEYLTHRSLSGELSMKELLVKLVTAQGFLNRLP